MLKSQGGCPQRKAHDPRVSMLISMLNVTIETAKTQFATAAAFRSRRCRVVKCKVESACKCPYTINLSFRGTRAGRESSDPQENWKLWTKCFIQLHSAAYYSVITNRPSTSVTREALTAVSALISSLTISHFKATMCQAIYKIHPICGHEWLHLVQPCRLGGTLWTCPHLNATTTTISSKTITPFPQETISPSAACPCCLERDEYYGGTIRTLLKSPQVGVRIGTGPDPWRNSGCDVPCCCCAIM
jgi:hypothetical protein